jgi:hypothetical protein
VAMSCVYQLNGPVTHMMIVEMHLMNGMNFVVSRLLVRNIQTIRIVLVDHCMFTWNIL